MNDLIDRQDAIDVCNKAIDLWQGQLGEGIVIAVRKKIEELTSAQPQCKKGKWGMVSQHENPPTYIYSCSECRYKSFGFYNYCPNCGARMEGKS